MTLNFAVDRLYETGWLPGENLEMDRLPSGLRFPTVLTVQRIFNDAGLLLEIKPHLIFGCCRAEWTFAETQASATHIGGTVIGSCEREAAVFALAKLREQLAQLKIANVNDELLFTA